MATERFAGGRGIALDTQTNVNVKPMIQNSGWCDNLRHMGRTTVAGGHKKHGEIPPAGGHSRQGNDITDHDYPPPSCLMEEALPCPIYEAQRKA
jgi:hypothetical protein